MTGETRSSPRRIDPYMAQLVARRKELGLTQAHVARMLHMSPKAVSNHERGAVRLSVEIARLWARVVFMELNLTETAGYQVLEWPRQATCPSWRAIPYGGDA